MNRHAASHMGRIGLELEGRESPGDWRKSRGMTDCLGVDMKSVPLPRNFKVKRLTPEQRFWAKVNKTPGCWEWTAGIFVGKSHTYGAFALRPTKMVKAHRFSYELANGPIPKGMEIDHRCHNTLCVKPKHLRPATTKQNQENLLGAQVNSRSGVRGVCWDRGRTMWRATVTHFGKRHHVGHFQELSDAEAAVIAKRNELYTHNDMDRRTA